ncbi:GPW/gp25 family protein [Actinomadura sp. DC4]|uniref:GPW/gp25 family protein n=1 Tax=Actinomadura sp. DC4 TaxID=3055069 RepID=UPI0025B245F1|nr:GPW/gp25 family protein [Actinomadura sp. DC4]MDN3354884.1 GPW/gp25 family protein [Actinomadura sp. DC4]
MTQPIPGVSPPGPETEGAPTPYLGTGLAFPLRLDENGHFALNDMNAHVRQAIGLILATGKGERIMRPDFGAGLSDLVFAPMSAATMTLVGHEVREALTRYEPRIDILALDVSADPDVPERLVITLDYRVRRTDTRLNLVYPFYLDRGGL